MKALDVVGDDDRVPAAVKMKALDVDGDGDNDLVLANERKPPTIWQNWPVANGHLGEFFELDTTLTDGASDVTVADVNNDGLMDVLLAYETGFEVILHPASGTTQADYRAKWKAAGAAAEKVEVPAKYIEVADMNGDGYPDVIVAGGSGAPEKITIYFGSADTETGGDYSSAVQTKAEVGSQRQAAEKPTGAVLALQVVDMDGDGYQDVVASFEGTYKRVFFGSSLHQETADIKLKNAGPIQPRMGVEVTNAALSDELTKPNKKTAYTEAVWTAAGFGIDLPLQRTVDYSLYLIAPAGADIDTLMALQKDRIIADMGEGGITFTDAEIEMEAQSMAGSVEFDFDPKSGFKKPDAVLTIPAPADAYYVTIKYREPATAPDGDWWPMLAERLVQDLRESVRGSLQAPDDPA